jgi:hypothetical protein
MLCRLRHLCLSKTKLLKAWLKFDSQYFQNEEPLHRSTVTVTIIIKSGYHKGMIQYVMVTVENVSPTGATITITFVLTVTAAINSGSLWRDFT